MATEKNTISGKISIILEMVKISHTIFALPVAVMSAILASSGWPSIRKLVLIILAMTGARNGAMAFNRLVDLKFDSQNPRTAARALPQGKLTAGQVKAFIIACSVLFIGSAYFLGRLAFIISPFALGIIFGYSYTKRFTPYAHLFLGIALGLAPIGAWIAIRDSLGLVPVILALAIVFWVAGFDIIYSCQDADVDQNLGLHSIPQHFGIKRALIISAFFHVLTLALLIWLKFLADLGIFYSLSCLAVGVLLFYEHYIVRPNDLSRLNQAFATLNAMVSVILLAGTILDRVF